MLYTIMLSKSNLDGDPDSTASLLLKIQTVERILSHFSDKDGLDEASMHAFIAKNHYHI